MFNSLYLVLQPLVVNKRTGSLSVTHASGETATILLDNGDICGVEFMDLRGPDAAKKIALWVNFSTRFSSQAIDRSDNSASISTDSFLTFLKKVAKRIEKIKLTITNDTDLFHFLPDKLSKQTEFNSAQLEIAMLLDGQRTITEIVSSAAQPELQTLSHIVDFYYQGFIKIVKNEKPLLEKERVDFLHGLNENLADALGPAAGIIIEDAFDTIKSDANSLSRGKVTDLIEAISSHLDPDEKAVFKKWTDVQLKMLLK